MALTKMASAIAAANTLTTLYTVPALTTSNATLIICNGSDNQVEVDVAIAALATPTAGEYIAKGMPLAPGETKTLTTIITAAELVVVKTTSAGVSFRLAGDVV